MEPFVAELSNLYRLAAATPAEQFRERVLAQLHDWIRFDGAVFGFGTSGANALEIGGSAIYNRDPAILSDYAAVAAKDPVTQRFVHEPGTLMNVDTQAYYTGKSNQQIAQFSSSHDIRHLMLLGEKPGADNPLRWIVLYRGTQTGFNDVDAARLATAWSHVLCALELNRARTLDLHAAPDSRRALALANRGGTFEIADPMFLALLRKEWRDLPATRLPAAAFKALQDGKAYIGRDVEIHFFRNGDCIVCQARRRIGAVRLSPREAEVAHYFSTGHSYKAIAERLAISPNTVRAQLASVYLKLGINDKAMLAAALAAQST